MGGWVDAVDQRCCCCCWVLKHVGPSRLPHLFVVAVAVDAVLTRKVHVIASTAEVVEVAVAVSGSLVPGRTFALFICGCVRRIVSTLNSSNSQLTSLQ